MWVENTNKGKFKFIERYKDPLTLKYKRVSITMDKNTAQTRKMAQGELQKKIDVLLSNVHYTQKNYTFHELVEAYRIDQLHLVKQSTYSRNYHACNTLISILGENTLVNRFTASYVKKSFIETGKSSGTLNEHLKRFKALMRWGYENDIVNDISFLSKIKPFTDTPRRVKIQDKFLEKEELQAVINEMSDSTWILLTKFLALTGMRVGEACALRVDDVDLDNRTIHVNKNFDYINKVETSTKNEYSSREVHMQPELFQVCKDINMLMQKRRICYNIKNCKLFIFDATGSHIHYPAYNKYLKTYAKKVTEKHITVHALRHTHASLLLEQGFSLDEIARRLGHGNSKVTREIYTHVTKKLKEKDNAKLDHVSLL